MKRAAKTAPKIGVICMVVGAALGQCRMYEYCSMYAGGTSGDSNSFVVDGGRVKARCCKPSGENFNQTSYTVYRHSYSA